jgi:hypothetical protein
MLVGFFLPVFAIMIYCYYCFFFLDCAVPVFSRPVPSTRSRSSTCTFSSGGDTPPLLSSDGSSISGGSQSSIDLSQIDFALSNTIRPMPTAGRHNVNRARARARHWTPTEVLQVSHFGLPCTRPLKKRC